MWKPIAAALIAMGATVASAQPRPYDRDRDDYHRPEFRWTHLATRNVDGAERRDIEIGKNAGMFRVVKLEAVRGVPRVTRVEVVFGDGSRQESVVNQKMDRSNPQAILDLKGDRRHIERVVVYTDRDSYGEVMVSGG